jgi:hypothetical protein
MCNCSYKEPPSNDSPGTLLYTSRLLHIRSLVSICDHGQDAVDSRGTEIQRVVRAQTLYIQGQLKDKFGWRFAPDNIGLLNGVYCKHNALGNVLLVIYSMFSDMLLLLLYIG